METTAFRTRRLAGLLLAATAVVCVSCGEPLTGGGGIVSKQGAASTSAPQGALAFSTVTLPVPQNGNPTPTCTYGAITNPNGVVLGCGPPPVPSPAATATPDPVDEALAGADLVGQSVRSTRVRPGRPTKVQLDPEGGDVVLATLTVSPQHWPPEPEDRAPDIEVSVTDGLGQPAMTGVRIESGDPFGDGRLASHLVVLTGLRGETRTLVVSSEEEGWVSVQTQVEAQGVTAEAHAEERKGSGLLVRATLRGVRPEDFARYSARASVTTAGGAAEGAQLRDDGAGSDRAAGDGVFSGLLPLPQDADGYVVFIHVRGPRDRHLQVARGF